MRRDGMILVKKLKEREDNDHEKHRNTERKLSKQHPVRKGGQMSEGQDV